MNDVAKILVGGGGGGSSGSLRSLIFARARARLAARASRVHTVRSWAHAQTRLRVRAATQLASALVLLGSPWLALPAAKVHACILCGVHRIRCISKSRRNKSRKYRIREEPRWPGEHRKHRGPVTRVAFNDPHDFDERDAIAHRGPGPDRKDRDAGTPAEQRREANTEFG